MSEYIPSDGWLNNVGVSIHYCDWSGGAPTLLCIHGLTANARFWDYLAIHLKGKYRVIAVDLRGRGLSAKPPAGSYGLERHVEDLSALLDTLDCGPVGLVGHSMGAVISGLLASRRPERISHVVLVDPGYVAEGASEVESRRELAVALGRLKMVFPSKAAFLDYWQNARFLRPWPEDFERYVAGDGEERPDGSVVSRCSQIAAEEDFTYLNRERTSLRNSARQVAVPTEVLWAPLGLQSVTKPLIQYEVVEEVTALLPKGHLTVVEDSNHFTIAYVPALLEAIERVLTLPRA